MLLLCLTIATLACSDPSVEAAAWLQSSIKQAGSWYPSVPVRIDWEVEQHSTLTDKELADLGALVRDRPEHPRQTEYQRAIAERSGQRSIMAFSLAAADATQWRFNLKGPAGSYIDQGQNSSEVWQLSEPALITAKNGDAADFHPEAGRSDARRMLLNALAGGIQSSEIAPWHVVTLSRRTDGQFSAVVNQPGVQGEQPVGTLVFRWDENLQRGFTERFEWPQSAEPGGYELYEGWKSLSKDVWYCSTIKSFDKLGHLYAECRITDIKAISNSELGQLTKTPAIGTTDPYRGRLAPRQSIEYNRDGAATVRASDGDVRARTPAPQAVPRSTWSFAGWVIAACLMVVTAFLWHWRRQNA